MSKKNLPFICSAIGLFIILIDTLLLIGNKYGSSIVTFRDASISLLLTIGIWFLGFLSGKSVDK